MGRGEAARDADPPRVDHRLEPAPPGVEEGADAGGIGGQVLGLPGEGLEQRRVAGHVVDHLGRGQPGSAELGFEVGHHNTSPTRRISARFRGAWNKLYEYSL